MLHLKLRTISIDKINEEFGDHHTFTRDKNKILKIRQLIILVKEKIQIYTRVALIYYNITMKWDIPIQKR